MAFQAGFRPEGQARRSGLKGRPAFGNPGDVGLFGAGSMEMKQPWPVAFKIPLDRHKILGCYYMNKELQRSVSGFI